MISIKKILSLILCLSIMACKPYPKEVEKALIAAGKNKSNLIYVLEHYKSKDSQKYNAACFLIANMPYHKSNRSLTLSPQYKYYFRKMDSIYQKDPTILYNDSLLQTFANEFSSLPLPQERETDEDVKILTKDFLIGNIDAAFAEWKTSPLLKNMNFDDFKELILPYRTADEPLTAGKTALRQLIYKQISCNGMENIIKPIEQYKIYVRRQKKINKHIAIHSHIGVYDLFIPAFIMDCHNLAATTCNLFRSCGIPAVYEFTPQWPDKDSKHYWCNSPDSTSIFHPYTPPYNNLGEDWELSLKYVGKVYRLTFAAQKNTPYFLKAKNEVIPDVFREATMIDVTSNYHDCIDITLPAPHYHDNELAYLSFFSSNGLNPVAWGSIDNQKKTVQYKNVPINMLFFPTYMKNDGQLIEFDTPFILRQDSIAGTYYKDIISCNHQMKLSMHVERKYPHKPHLVYFRNKIKGAVLLAANKIGGPYDTLYTLKESPQPYWQQYIIKNTKKYRFYKLQTKGSSPINIAEYEFLVTKNSEDTCLLPSKLPIFNSLQSRQSVRQSYEKIIGEPLRSGPLRYQAFDGNLDTYIESSWFGMDFRVPVCIKGIQLYPRNARNGIEPNNTYQLLYYDKGNWVEHSIIRSVYNYLDFDAVPSGTIYWLRNLSQGKEELPFFYKEGKQVFINELIH